MSADTTAQIEIFEQAIRDGEVALANDDLGAATAAFMLAARRSTVAGQPLRRLATVLAHAGRPAGMERDLSAVSDNRAVLLDLYRSACARKQHRVALAYLDVLLARFPDDPELVSKRRETSGDVDRRDVTPAPDTPAPGTPAPHPLARDPHAPDPHAPDPDAPDPLALIAQGQSLLADGRSTEAEGQFRAALAIAPNHRSALVGLFHAGRGRVSPREELDRIEAVIATGDADPALLLDRAEALIRMGQPAAAEEAAGRILADHPTDPRAMMVLVQAARVRHDPNLLLERIERVAQVAPDHPDVPWDRVTALVELGRVEAAKPLMAELAQSGANDPETHLRLGRLARAAGDRGAALAHFECALALVPDHAAAKLDACAELTTLGRYAEASALAETLSGDASYAVDAAMCRGFIARQQADRGGALAWFRAALDAAPDHDGAALNAAAELAELGETNEAEALAQAVLQRAGEGATTTRIQAFLRLGHVAQLRPDHAAAVRHFEAAAALAPNDADVLAQLSAEYRDQGRFEDAARVLARIDALRPASLSTLLAHGHLARRQGDHAGALARYQAAHEAFPASADPLSEIAIEQRALNNLAASEAALQQALEREPSHIDAAMRMAETHYMAERYDECLALCQAIRSRLPQLVPAWLIESRVLADRDSIAAALALLDEAQAAVGLNANLLARRIDLLRDTGDYPAIRALVATDLVRETRHPGLWASAMRAMLRFATLDELDAWMTRAPAGAIGPEAEAEEFRGMLAEVRWRFPEALTHYRNVVRIDPNRNSIEQDVARVCLTQLDVDAARSAMDRYVRFCAGERSLRGESIKASQTHVGQLLDEYRLDAETVRALVEAKSLPLAERITAAKEIVVRNRQSTAAAAFLLVTLREAGLFDDRKIPEPNARPIARYIVQYWYQTKQPPDVAALTRSWQEHHPDYAYQCFDDTDAQEWLKLHHQPAVLLAYQRTSEYAQKADIFRLAVLSVGGGIYADADDRCLGPLDPLIGGAHFLAYQEDYGTLGNNILACTRNHPVIRRALALAVTATNRGDTDLLWLSTGPGLLSRAFAEVVSSRSYDRLMSLDTTQILDRRTLGSVMAMHCQVQYKSTESHWLKGLMK